MQALTFHANVRAGVHRRRLLGLIVVSTRRRGVDVGTSVRIVGGRTTAKADICRIPWPAPVHYRLGRVTCNFLRVKDWIRWYRSDRLRRKLGRMVWCGRWADDMLSSVRQLRAMIRQLRCFFPRTCQGRKVWGERIHAGPWFPGKPGGCGGGRVRGYFLGFVQP